MFEMMRDTALRSPTRDQARAHANALVVESHPGHNRCGPVLCAMCVSRPCTLFIVFRSARTSSSGSDTDTLTSVSSGGS